MHSVAILSIFTLSVAFCQNDRPPLNQKLLVVSFDAFGYKNFDDGKHNFPEFESFRQDGVYSDKFQSIYPSETFPNHWSIATGMYAESHGIVSNYMYDPSLNESFNKRNRDVKWWGEAEPIWITAKKQSIKTAVSFWPGSDVEFLDGLKADYWRVYNRSVTFDSRIDEMIEHLAKDGVHLGMLYHKQPDSIGHIYGVGSKEFETELENNDKFLTSILKKLDKVGLTKDKINVILCADHGMVNKNKTYFLSDYMDTDELIERVSSIGFLY